mmetsp:Transcript_11855/g.33828  ORF Transcript_11855/g.33828 Transcript_11855/m.33828 type:complete len:659 (+) Transcript_11855:1648-3624(+)
MLNLLPIARADQGQEGVVQGSQHVGVRRRPGHALHHELLHALLLAGEGHRGEVGQHGHAVLRELHEYVPRLVELAADELGVREGAGVQLHGQEVLPPIDAALQARPHGLAPGELRCPPAGETVHAAARTLRHRLDGDVLHGAWHRQHRGAVVRRHHHPAVAVRALQCPHDVLELGFLDLLPHALEHLQHEVPACLGVLRHDGPGQQLLVQVEHHHLLRLVRLREAEELDERGARRRVHHQRQKRDAAGEKQHPLRRFLLHGASRTVNAHLDGQCEAQGATEAAPSDDDGLRPRDLRAVRAQPLHDGAGGEDERATDERQDDVEDEEVEVVDRLDDGHRLACESSGKEEDDGVAEVLEHVPNVLHGLLLHDGGPHLVGQDEARRDATQNAAHLQHALGDDEARVGAADGERDLDRAAVVLEAVLRGLDPEHEEPADDPAHAEGAEDRAAQEDEHRRHVVVRTFQHVVRHCVQDDRRAVVQERLARDQHRQRGGGAKLFEKADDGDGVRGTKDGAHREAEQQVPLQVKIDEAGDREGANADAGRGQVDALARHAPSNGGIDRHRVTGEQDRQHREQQQVRVDAHPHPVGLPENAHLLLEAYRMLQERVGDAQHEQGNGVLDAVQRGECADLEDDRPDEQGDKEEYQRIVRVRLVLRNVVL